MPDRFLWISPARIVHFIAENRMWYRLFQIMEVHMGSSPKVSLFLVGLTLVVLTGCGASTSPNLPDSLTITMPNGSTQTVNLGSGPAALANSTWACYRVTDNTTLLARLEFGADGKILRIYDNTFLPEQIGTEFTPDGLVHSLAIYGVEYAAGSFGISVGQDFGFSVPINAWFLGTQVVSGTVYGSGTVGTNSFTGKIGYTAQIYQTSITQAGTSSGEYAIYAVREK
jgi:hypothetical protein